MNMTSITIWKLAVLHPKSSPQWSLRSNSSWPPPQVKTTNKDKSMVWKVVLIDSHGSHGKCQISLKPQLFSVSVCSDSLKQWDGVSFPAFSWCCFVFDLISIYISSFIISIEKMVKLTRNLVILLMIHSIISRRLNSTHGIHTLKKRFSRKSKKV